MSQALYRKYRSKKLSEIVGQEHITKTLDNALKTGKISHAYLFTGPRGVGKTSIARILAHEINGLDYTDESMHLDIIEIDAASNRRIDEIRDLREKVHIAPTSSKYKVYIIDEVHMLTKEAFNALLKTLEEPPAHVIFILATTELHKLPETIVSRTQRFTFKLIDDATVAKHLRTIADTEKMDITDDALELLAKQGHGSFRDSISLLDQVGHSGAKITKTDAEKLVGIAASDQIDRLLASVRGGSSQDILAGLDQLIADGINPGQTAKQLAVALRSEIVSGNTSPILVKLLGDLLEVQVSPSPATKLEVVLLDANLSSPTTAHIQTAPEAVVSPPEPELVEVKQPVIKAEISVEPAASPEATASAKDDLAEWWGEVLGQIKAINNTLYGSMRMAIPKVDGDTLNLFFKFSLHAKKATETATQAKIVDAIQKVTGKTYQINAVVDKSIDGPIDFAVPKPELPAKSSVDEAPLNSIQSIFGGGEVLES